MLEINVQLAEMCGVLWEAMYHVESVLFLISLCPGQSLQTEEELTHCILCRLGWHYYYFFFFLPIRKEVTLYLLCCQMEHSETVSLSAESFAKGSAVGNLVRKINLDGDHMNSPWNESPWLKLQPFPGFIASHVLHVVVSGPCGRQMSSINWGEKLSAAANLPPPHPIPFNRVDWLLWGQLVCNFL